jgi:hypothetical protein
LLLLSIGWKNVVSQCNLVSTSKYPDGIILLNASSRLILKENYVRYHSPMANKVTSKELQERQDEYMYVDVREADELEEGKISEILADKNFNQE